MPKEVRIVAANDPIGALLSIAEAFAGGPAVFLSPPKALDETPTGVTARATSSATALIIESSGSTGYPKRIELSQSALVASAEATISRLGGAGQWLLALPVNYIAGAQVLVRSLLSETQPVVMNTAVPFTAEGFARAASQMTGSRRYAALVPTQLHRLATAIQDEFLLEQLKRFDAILVGGQAVNQIDFAILVDAGVNLIETYGMPETAGGTVWAIGRNPLNTISLFQADLSACGQTFTGTGTAMAVPSMGAFTSTPNWVVTLAATRVNCCRGSRPLCTSHQAASMATSTEPALSTPTR